MTTLRVAVEKGNLAKLRQLYQRGVRINDARKKATTPLHVAAARGYPDVRCRWCAAWHGGSVFLSSLGRRWRPRCSFAATTYYPSMAHVLPRCVDLQVCRLLLLTKADIECRDSMGQTPMHLAVHSGSVRTSQATTCCALSLQCSFVRSFASAIHARENARTESIDVLHGCLLYTSPSPRDRG